MHKHYLTAYHRWMDQRDLDSSVRRALDELAGDDARIADAFYRELTFGTGGLRGLMGPGTNRVNRYTVAKASQGLANYVIKHFEPARRQVAVSYDSRIQSDVFAQTAAGVWAANGIHAHIFPQLMPTPCLSYAVRRLGCVAGVMITASHNPAHDNGYKVYGPDGCQITPQIAEAIGREIERLDIFREVKGLPFEQGLMEGKISWIGEDTYTAFIEAVKGQSMLYGEAIDPGISIVYTPLNGAGRGPVLRLLREKGFANVTVVREQEMPDGNFPTCPIPNPEVPEALALGMAYAKAQKADLLLATDPDCDRVGVALPNLQGDYVPLTGNETGLLLLDYICGQRAKHGAMPKTPVMVKTLVTTDLAEDIAAHYGVQTINVLTGFKFIGQQISLLEAQNPVRSYIFGFEESCGFLSGDYVRDKDAVGGAFLICEMLAYYKARGIRLLEKLETLYQTYGFCLNGLHSYPFSGAAGGEKMQRILAALPGGMAELGGKQGVSCLDYRLGLGGLPKSDMLKFIWADGCWAVVRPSGTEPKLKVYLSARGESREQAEGLIRQMGEAMEKAIEKAGRPKI